MAFREASNIEKVRDGLYRANIPDGWQQGRGAFGGLVLGTLMRAAQDAEPERDRRPRSFNAELVGPVAAGAAEVEVEVLRRGNNLTAVDSRLRQNGEVLARGTALLARDRDVAPAGIVAQPPVEPAPWEECLIAPLQAPIAPVFTQHYEFRPFEGLPFSGGDVAASAGWVREKERPCAIDYPAVLGLLDSFWPVMFAISDEIRPGATISFASEFFIDPADLDPEQPVYFRSRGRAEQGGYFLEERTLWSGDQPIAMNQQVFAIIK